MPGPEGNEGCNKVQLEGKAPGSVLPQASASLQMGLKREKLLIKQNRVVCPIQRDLERPEK